MKVQIADRHGEIVDYAEATIVANAEKNKKAPHDMCLIKSEDHGLPPLELHGDMSVVEVEDPIVVIGAPSGYFPVRRDGFIISMTSQDPPHLTPRELMFLAVNIEPGSSGCPVIWNGKVIGIVVRYLYDHNLKDGALATRGDHVVEFVDRHIDRSQ